jgi:hypothetical protein
MQPFDRRVQAVLEVHEKITNNLRDRLEWHNRGPVAIRCAIGHVVRRLKGIPLGAGAGSLREVSEIR